MSLASKTGKATQASRKKAAAAGPKAAASAALPHGFAAAVIDWQRESGRHDLPWQNTRDPYRIWLSEIMLQQTQVAAVIPYYQRFLEHFPTLADLAAAPLDEVMRLWSGLGYYSRARNLHACAVKVASEHGGTFPESAEIIETLPGIGRSTAAAIASFSFGERVAILDGNVKRVLARLFGIATPLNVRETEKQMWQLAEQLLPELHPSKKNARETLRKDMQSYTQGLMDLGATLCMPKKAQCPQCPVSAMCVAHGEGSTERIPAAKVRAAIPERSTTMLILTHGGMVMLERRPPTGIWGGLWSLPEIDVADPANLAALHPACANIGIPLSVQTLTPFSHTFTHFRLHITPLLVRLAKFSPAVGDTASPRQWIALENVNTLGLPTPVAKLMDKLTLLLGGKPGKNNGDGDVQRDLF